MILSGLRTKAIPSSSPIRGKRSKIIGLINDNWILNQDMFCEVIKDFMNTDYTTDEELTLIYCSSKGENE